MHNISIVKTIKIDVRNKFISIPFNCNKCVAPYLDKI